MPERRWFSPARRAALMASLRGRPAQETPSILRRALGQDVADEALAEVAWELANEPGLRVEAALLPLLDQAPVVAGEQVATMLARLGGLALADLPELVPGWPLVLDRLCCRAWHDNPAPLQALQGLSSELARGRSLVSARFGVSLSEPRPLLAALARQLLTEGGWQGPLLEPGPDGSLQEIELLDCQGRLHGDGGVLFQVLGGLQSWAEILLEQALQGPPPAVGLEILAPALERADPEQLLALLQRLRFDADGLEELEEALSRRGLEVSELLALAEQLQDDHLTAELLALVVLRRCQAEHRPAPRACDGLIRLRSVVWERGRPGSSVAVLRACLRGLPGARGAELLERELLRDGARSRVWPFLRLFPERRLDVQALARLQVHTQPDLDRLAALSLGGWGYEALPRLALELRQANQPGARKALHLAMLYILVDALPRVPESRFDALLRFEPWAPHDFAELVRWELESLLRALPWRRASAVLEAGLREQASFGRAFACLHCLPRPALVERAVGRLAAGEPTREQSWDWGVDGLRHLGRRAWDLVGGALRAGAADSLHLQAGLAWGEDVYRSLLGF